MRSQGFSPEKSNQQKRVNIIRMHYDCEEFVAALGMRIKTLRQERGWTQIRMVRDFGYYLSHWQNIEAGKKMSLETMLRVANTFDIGLDELLCSVKRRRGIGFGSKGYYSQEPRPKKKRIS
jgi:transcriptional regulator with XRE-family HTH domain